MKQKFFGNKIDEDDFIKDGSVEIRNVGKLAANVEEFYTPRDKFSARTLNRPLLENFEDTESIYELVQTMMKTLYGQNEVGIIPDIFEELNPDKLAIGKFIDNSRRYVRIPTGAFLAKLTDAQKNYYAYTLTEDNQYSRDFFVDNDRNAITIFNKPNTDLFERQLAEHFNINLNDQDNDIRLYYQFFTEPYSSGTLTTEQDFITDNDNKYALVNNLQYYINVSRTSYEYSPTTAGATVIENKPVVSRIPIDPNSYCLNSFELVRNFYNSFSSYLTKEDDMFSLEEVMEIPYSWGRKSNASENPGNWKADEGKNYATRDIAVYFDPFTNETKPKKDANGNELSYSFSNRFVMKIHQNNDEFDNSKRYIKLFSFTIDIPQETGQGWIDNSGDNSNTSVELTSSIRDKVCYLKRIDRTTLTIKNINLTNVLNNLVVENRQDNINISEAHIKPEKNEKDNISIGLQTLGYTKLNRGGDTEGLNRELWSEGDKRVLGENNIAIGTRAMIYTTEESTGVVPKNNIAIGNSALSNVSAGTDNIEIGYGSGSIVNAVKTISIGNNIKVNHNIGDEKNKIKTAPVLRNKNTVIGHDNLPNIKIALDANSILGHDNDITELDSNNTVIGNNNLVKLIGGAKETNALSKNVIVGNDNGHNDANGSDRNLGKGNYIVGEGNSTKRLVDENYIIGKNNQTDNASLSSTSYVFGKNNGFNTDAKIVGDDNVVTGEKNRMVGSKNTFSDDSEDNIAAGDGNAFKDKSSKNFLSGNSNKLTAASSNVVEGHENTISSSNSNVVVGKKNTVSSKGDNILVGKNNKISGTNNLIVSDNITKYDHNNAIVFGTIGNNIGTIEGTNDASANQVDKNLLKGLEADLLIGPRKVVEFYKNDEDYDDNKVTESDYLLKTAGSNTIVRSRNIIFETGKFMLSGMFEAPIIKAEKFFETNAEQTAQTKQIGPRAVPTAGYNQDLAVDVSDREIINNIKEYKSFVGTYDGGYIISARHKNGYSGDGDDDRSLCIWSSANSEKMFRLKYLTTELVDNKNTKYSDGTSRELLDDWGNQKIKNHLEIGETLTVGNDTALKSNLAVTKNTTIGGTLTVANDTTLNSNLKVAKNTTIGGDLHMVGTSAIYLDGAANLPVIKLMSGAADGHGIIVGGGGATVIGGGESANTYYTGAGFTGNAEKMVVANDTDIVFVSNLQNGYGSGITMTYDASGGLSVPGALSVGGDTVLNKTLTVKGATSAEGNLTVGGDTALNKTLTVKETADIGSHLTVSGYARMVGTRLNNDSKTNISDTYPAALPQNAIQIHSVYTGNGPASYGNLINIGGEGGGQIFIEWSDSQNKAGEDVSQHIWFRSKRDNVNGWTKWKQLVNMNDVIPESELAGRIPTTKRYSNDGTIWVT